MPSAEVRSGHDHGTSEYRATAKFRITAFLVLLAGTSGAWAAPRTGLRKPVKPAPVARTATTRKPVAPARKALPPAPVPERLEVHPREVRLDGKRAYRQLVVTGSFKNDARDLTHSTEYRVSDPRVVRIEKGRVIAVGDGKATLTLRVGGRSAQVPVVVTRTSQAEPVSFPFETLAVLTKQGCASGSCHGSPQGKGGFSLSLFGYDPRLDQVSLTRDGFNRRINVLEPAESLILKKPLLEIPHVGGKKLRKTDAAYRILHDWVYQGANVELPRLSVERITLAPGSSRVLRAPHLKQQLGVQAHFSDGTVRDVTAIATYESSHPNVATVDPHGLITGRSRGQAAISVRYLEHLESVYITVVQDVPGFQWQEVPENNFIDRLVHAKLKQLQYLPSGTCSDEVFIRRVYLDLTGLLPTPERVRRFLTDCVAEGTRTHHGDTETQRAHGEEEEDSGQKAEGRRQKAEGRGQKAEGRGQVGQAAGVLIQAGPELRNTQYAIRTRSRLIDELLASEDFARFWALKKADLMRVSPRRLKDGRAELFARWLVEAVRTNMPHDRFAREILTAVGDTEKVAAANYFLAIPSMEERTEMTAQIFMGSRVECAKCHNHPFENWTMRDYYSLAAVFARTRTDEGEVVLADTGEALHPATQEKMTPWGMPADPRQAQAAADRRTFFAEWLTRKGNPFFARVEANRIWADLLGRGIVDPVDDFRSSNPPANVELLDALAREFENSDFDRKHLIRLICNSRAYQRSTATNRFNETEEALFSHARIRLLTAEQLRDAIGYTTRVLTPTPALPQQLALLRQQVEARLAEMTPKFPAWLERTAEEAAGLPFRLGGWYFAGPFKADDVNQGIGRVLGPERQPVDLAARYEEGRGWELRTDFRDGAANPLSTGRNQVHYLFRRIYTAEPRSLTIRLRAGEATRVWLNGGSLTPEPLRGEKPVKLDLRLGENTLLIKVASGRPDSSFAFRLNPQDPGVAAVTSLMRGLPAHVIEILALPRERRTAAQEALLREHYFESDSRVRSFRAQLDRLEARMDYATQRPYPEASTFTAAFGQPVRETACTCERQTSPTLLQALELLNGGMAFQMVSRGAPNYQAMDDEQLVEELYLSALSRLPTDAERRTSRQYLSQRANREEAAMDLVWALINTQEFLFQH